MGKILNTIKMTESGSATLILKRTMREAVIIYMGRGDTVLTVFI